MMSNNNNNHHSSVGSVGSGGYLLQLGEEIPTFPFVNKPLIIPLYLLDSEQKTPILGHNVPLTVQLCYQGNEHNPIANIKDIVEIDESTLSINSFGVAEVRMTFLQLSLAHSNRKFVFRFTIKGETLQSLSSNTSKAEDTSPFPVDLTVLTVPMLVVRLRLQLQMDLNNAQVEDFAPIAGSTTNNTMNIWYKDEGGKDHGIDLTISVLDDDHGLPLSSLPHPIPYMITLLYSTGDTVLFNQQKGNILTILPDPNNTVNTANNNAISGNNASNTSPVACVIDASRGSNTKRIRINDISKNHQRQSFIIRITPDITKLKHPYVYSSDIAPVDSMPIEVRSKRTKRPRADDEEGEGAANLPAAAVTSSNSGTVQKSTKSANVPQTPNAAIPANSSQLIKKIKPDGKIISSHSLDDVEEHNNTPRPAVESVESAIRHMLTWTEHVLQGFQDLRWKLIGYDTAHGQPQQPLYAMSNPNVLLDRLQEEYVQQVYDSLTFIVSKNTDSNNSSNGKHGAAGKSSKAASKRSSSSSALAATTPTANSSSSGSKKAAQHIPPAVTNSSSSSRSNMTTNNYAMINVDEGITTAPTQYQPFPPSSSSSSSLYPALYADSTPTNPAVQSVENTVYYIVALPYDVLNNKRASGHGNGEELFFPAYDHNQELVGFYTEKKDERNATIIHFYALSSLLPPGSNHLSSTIHNLSFAHVVDRNKAKSFLLFFLQINDNDDVYSLPKANFSLENMKHEAMVHYWLAEVGLDEFS